MAILRDAKGRIVNADELEYSDVVGKQVVCPGCHEYTFGQWPYGWDSHAVHKCSGSIGGTEKERKARYKNRFRHLFKSDGAATPRSGMDDRRRRSDPAPAALIQTRMDRKRFPELIQEIYRAVDELERMFPGRHFTPDGHMVGSIGEALAMYYYGVELFTASFKSHDGKIGDRFIQVKATQASCISIGSEPRYLLVLKLSRDGSFREIYNGPGDRVWALVRHKPLPKNAQYQVRLSTLRALMESVPIAERFPRVQN